MDWKKLSNPFLILTVSLLVGYLVFADVMYGLIVFFVFSFANGMRLELSGARGLFLFVYGEMAFSLVFLLPILYVAGVKLVYSLAMLGMADFIIQMYYVLSPSKEGVELLEVWSDRFVGSRQRWFHPVSMIYHMFSDFSVEIMETRKANPLRDHVYFTNFLVYHLRRNIRLHQFGAGDNYVFSFYTDRYKDCKKKTINGRLLCEEAVKEFGCKEAVLVNKGRYDTIRISLNRKYVLQNEEKVYQYLKEVFKKLR